MFGMATLRKLQVPAPNCSPLNIAFCAALAAVCIATTFATAADDVIRCRSGRLVNVGMVAPEVVARCGEPQSRSAEDIPVRARTPNGNVVVTGSTHVERWTYQRGQGQFDAVLTFEGDKLVRIDLLNVR
jgi:hypothetical protein